MVSFGGDGTLNEAANGLAGSSVPLSVLPGGSTNVVCRMLGIPTDVVDATEHLLAAGRRPRAAADRHGTRQRPLLRLLQRRRHRRRRDALGRRPPAAEGARRRRDLHATRRCAATSATTAAGPPLLEVEVGDERVAGVSAIVQNSDPFTYFRTTPLRVCEDIALDDGTISLTVDAARRAHARRARASCTACSRARDALRSTARRRASRASSTRPSRSLDGERALPARGGRRLHRRLPEAVYEAAPGSLLVIA